MFPFSCSLQVDHPGKFVMGGIYIFPIFCADTVTTLTSGISSPTAIGFTPSGSLTYVLTSYQILTMPIIGSSTTILAGSASGFADGPGNVATFNGATDLVVHPGTGVMYITDQYNNRIRTCTPSGRVNTLTGSAIVGNVDGPSNVASFNQPFGIVMDPSNTNLYVTCYGANTLRQVVISTAVTTTTIVAGTFRFPTYGDYYTRTI